MLPRFSATFRWKPPRPSRVAVKKQIFSQPIAEIRNQIPILSESDNAGDSRCRPGRSSQIHRHRSHQGEAFSEPPAPTGPGCDSAWHCLCHHCILNHKKIALTTLRYVTSYYGHTIKRYPHPCARHVGLLRSYPNRLGSNSTTVKLRCNTTVLA